MRLTLGSSPSKTRKRDRYVTKDLAVINKRFKIAFIPVLIVLICSIGLNLFQYFNNLY